MTYVTCDPISIKIWQGHMQEEGIIWVFQFFNSFWTPHKIPVTSNFQRYACKQCLAKLTN